MARNVIYRQDDLTEPWHLYEAEDATGGAVALCGYRSPVPFASQKLWPDPVNPPELLCKRCAQLDADSRGWTQGSG